ncbi:DUF599 family protein [Martelella lutilitoris]|uniref:DUF599 family protein n=1 Tax=Martelella lutilitoris TaxID=2583532 RepID=A0A5C4JNE0_9HYPH|nr:DUF599 family protein [Martelella lutilitoris]TNB46986.1 DUF599 family protein [Martelella lutilitoris]
MTGTDFLALSFFLLCWFVFDSSVSGRFNLIRRTSLTSAMMIHRRRWMKTALSRDLRMIDTQILSGLQNGTAFFASTSIFAIGGCFALMGEADRAQMLFEDLPGLIPSTRAAFEMKAGGLAAIFGYSFFKFGWSYRLFNYNTILFGALPMRSDTPEGGKDMERMAEQIAEVNIIAARHFNTGLRAIFLSIGYLGWFLGPYAFMATTAFVFMILTRRQYFSEARRTILEATQSESGETA